MIRREEIIDVGKFQRTHALKGELNMISEVDPEYFLEGNPLIVETEGILVPYFVETVRPKGSTSYLVKLKEIDSEREASEFVNHTVYILKKDAEEWLGDDFEDESLLIGFNVLDILSGRLIGRIEGIEDSTSNVLFILKNTEGEEIFLPATQDFIEEIDEEKQIIKMKLPEGLIEINN